MVLIDDIILMFEEIHKKNQIFLDNQDEELLQENEIFLNLFQEYWFSNLKIRNTLDLLILSNKHAKKN